MLGKRDSTLYGTRSMEQIVLDLQRAYPNICFTYYQSNHEGDLIDRLQSVSKNDYQGIILNAGGYTHTSVSLRDAVELTAAPVIEVHLSDIRIRENFRRISLLTDVAETVYYGNHCYEEATRHIISTAH